MISNKDNFNKTKSIILLEEGKNIKLQYTFGYEEYSKLLIFPEYLIQSIMNYINLANTKNVEILVEDGKIKKEIDKNSLKKYWDVKMFAPFTMNYIQAALKNKEYENIKYSYDENYDEEILHEFDIYPVLNVGYMSSINNISYSESHPENVFSTISYILGKQEIYYNPAYANKRNIHVTEDDYKLLKEALLNALDFSLIRNLSTKFYMCITWNFKSGYKGLSEKIECIQKNKSVKSKDDIKIEFKQLINFLINVKDSVDNIEIYSELEGYEMVNGEEKIEDIFEYISNLGFSCKKIRKSDY